MQLHRLATVLGSALDTFDVAVDTKLRPHSEANYGSCGLPHLWCCRLFGAPPHLLGPSRSMWH